MKNWYRMQAPLGDVAEIHIIDFIGDWIDDYFGFGVTAKQFVDDLTTLPASVKTLRVRINSPGGDMFGALNIANALRAQTEKGRRVETVVDGLAASAATLVMMAGEKIQIADNAMIMIHNPWTVAAGNASELRKNADVLDQIRTTIIATYQWHAELSDVEIIALLDAETWMDADEAVAAGFATEKVSGLRAAASIDPRHVAKLGLKVPEKFRDRVAALLAPTAEQKTGVLAQEVLAACSTAGLDLKFALALVDAGLTPEALAQAVAGEKTSRAAEAARVKEITALCEKFKRTDLAPALVEGGSSADAARQIVAAVTALVDRVEIDSGLTPEGIAASGSKKSGLNPQEIYAQRNKR